MTRKLAALLLAWPLWVSCADAKPAQVILIRHAEKPPQGHHLSTKGRERAAALVPYFLETPEVTRFKTPVAIYAQKSTKEHPSLRPVETVEGLARALGLELILYPREDFARLVEEINTRPAYDGKMVLICWEHHDLHNVVKAFGIKGAPKYPDDAFDRTWVLSFGSDGKPTFKELRQKLLYGDSSD
jgi:hypothetical protein